MPVRYAPKTMGPFSNAETQRRRGRGAGSATDWNRRAFHFSASLRLCVEIAAVLTLTGALSASVPEAPKLPTMRATPPPPISTLRPSLQKRLIFGVGVGFEKTGAAQGAVISTLLPDSPASRGGLAVGCVVTEINGELTVGRAGDDCARMIRDAFGPVRLKYLDPALKEKTLTLDKAWLALPE